MLEFDTDVVVAAELALKAALPVSVNVPGALEETFEAALEAPAKAAAELATGALPEEAEPPHGAVMVVDAVIVRETVTVTAEPVTQDAPKAAVAHASVSVALVYRWLRLVGVATIELEWRPCPVASAAEKSCLLMLNSVPTAAPVDDLGVCVSSLEVFV